MSESSDKGTPSTSQLAGSVASDAAAAAKLEVAQLAADALAAEEEGPPPHHGEVGVPEEGPIVTTIGAPSESAVHKIPEKVKELLVGKPRDLGDQSVFHHVSLVAFLAWVGLARTACRRVATAPPRPS